MGNRKWDVSVLSDRLCIYLLFLGCWCSCFSICPGSKGHFFPWFLTYSTMAQFVEPSINPYIRGITIRRSVKLDHCFTVLFCLCTCQGGHRRKPNDTVIIIWQCVTGHHHFDWDKCQSIPHKSELCPELTLFLLGDLLPTGGLILIIILSQFSNKWKIRRSNCQRRSNNDVRPACPLDKDYKLFGVFQSSITVIVVSNSETRYD